MRAPASRLALLRRVVLVYVPVLAIASWLFVANAGVVNSGTVLGGALLVFVGAWAMADVAAKG